MRFDLLPLLAGASQRLLLRPVFPLRQCSFRSRWDDVVVCCWFNFFFHFRALLRFFLVPPGARFRFSVSGCAWPSGCDWVIPRSFDLRGAHSKIMAFIHFVLKKEHDEMPLKKSCQEKASISSCSFSCWLCEELSEFLALDIPI